MCNYWILQFFIIILIFLINNNNKIYCMENKTLNVCGAQCLKCGPKGCLKCPTLIMYPSRTCVTACPYGHNPQWSVFTDFMGRICIHNGNSLGVSATTLTILTGILTGTVLCLILIAFSVIYIKYKKRLLVPNNNFDGNSDCDDTPERRDFLKQLELLRPYSHTYLDMLNDTRRQLREAYRDGDSGALSAYKPVLRDLAKILILLNKPIEKLLSVPDDWDHLFNWSQKALKRYKRMSQASQAQVAQLINFLQSTPTSTTETNDTIMSTFKPDQVVFGSNLNITSYNTLNPQWKFEYSLVANNSSEFCPALWKNSKEYLNSTLLLDDDFCQLGFRPQDEITTEL